MKRFLLFRFAPLAALAACTGSVALGRAPDALAGSSGFTGPYAITCNIGWRAPGATALQNQTFTGRTNIYEHQLITFGGTTVLDITMQPAPDAPGSDTIIDVEMTNRNQHHQFRVMKNEPPVAQFLGGSGFTGSITSGDDLQYSCSAEGSAAPAQGSSVAPLDFTCDVDVTDSARQTITPATSNATPQITIDDLTFITNTGEDTNAGRSISVRATGSAASGAQSFGQVFQLDPRTPIENQLAGTSVTGTITIGSATSAHSLTYTCHASSVRNPDAHRSACSTGPAYPDGSVFPLIQVSTDIPPVCISRCDAAPTSERRIASVPNGTCSFKGERCWMDVDYYQNGTTEVCRTDGIECDCVSGSWSCGLTLPGVSACGVSPTACDSLTDNCSGAETFQTCTLSGGASSITCTTSTDPDGGARTSQCTCSNGGLSFAPPSAVTGQPMMVDLWKQHCGGECN